MKPLERIRTGQRLAARPTATQSDLRAAQSSAYYALFHALRRALADLIAGPKAEAEPTAWAQAYRALSHRRLRQIGRRAETMAALPEDLQDLAHQLRTLQERRLRADYEPEAHFTRSEVRTDLAVAEHLIRAFARAAPRDKRALATHLLLGRSRS